MKKTIAINDGIRDFAPKVVSSHDQSTPFASHEVTYLSITNKDHHISQISEGFIHLVARYDLRLSGIVSTDISDENHLLKLFVGHKSSNQILYQLWIRSNNAETGYEQNQMVREGFAMAAIQDHCSKTRHKYVHSLYEDVSKYNQYVCGTYVNIDDLKSGVARPYEIEYIIPFDDICALQAFDQYPNVVLGDIELKFYVRETGLVWCMIDPRQVLDTKTLIEEEAIDVELPKVIKYDHKFTQIGNPAQIVTKYSVSGNTATIESGVCTLNCDSMTVTKCESNMKGYKIHGKAIAEIAQIFSKPVYIPAQELNYNAFPTQPNEDGLQDTLNTALFNVTSMCVVFPRRPGDFTCFENPCIDNFYIKALGTQYPDKVGSTLGPRFLQDQLVAADLDGGLAPTKEFVDSFTQVKNDEKTGVRYKNCLSDGTSFMAIIQTERNGAGYVFDGIDSGGQSVPIEIGFRPLVRGDNDTYYNVVVGERAPTHPPAPQLWIVRDTYWSVDSTNGLRYHKFGTPEELQLEM